jgi:hypothetical protein
VAEGEATGTKYFFQSGGWAKDHEERRMKMSRRVTCFLLLHVLHVLPAKQASAQDEAAAVHASQISSRLVPSGYEGSKANSVTAAER